MPARDADVRQTPVPPSPMPVGASGLSMHPRKSDRTLMQAL